MNPFDYDRAIVPEEIPFDRYDIPRQRYGRVPRIAGALLFIILLVLCISKGEPSRGMWGRLGDGVSRLWYDKQIYVSGGVPYDEIELETHLPLDRSVLWWYFSRGEVESGLLNDPRIASVRLESCSETFDPGCFELIFEKRQGRFLVEVKDSPWLVAADGVFLSLLPVTKDQYQFVTDGRGAPLPIISGEFFYSISPDRVRAEIQFLDRATRLIERKIKRSVAQFTVERDGDLRVSFVGYGGEVVFSAAENFAALRREVHRLALLLQRIGIEKSVDTIDLSFENLAVVKLRPLDKADS